VAESSLYEQLGGEPKLRAVIDDFVDRVFADMMIGFFFARADKDRIKRFEFQHASALLGGPDAYAGRPLRQAHASHPIRGGHFARRMQILRHVLAAHAVPAEVQKRWIEHDLALSGQITGDNLGECND
jgi:truncated hemoglobin YjbI